MTRSHVWTAAAVVAAIALPAAGYWLGQRTTAPGAAAPVKAERKVLYWHDPMVPGPRFDRPGRSPYMDMDLVPVYADEARGAGGVAIDPRAQQNLGMRTAAVTEQDFGGSWTAVGNVAWDERATEVVTARSAGFLERLLVRVPYENVRAGQPLAELYAPDWVAAQEDFLAARRLATGGELVDAARQRLRLAGMTLDQIAAFERAGRVQPRVTLRAPQAGQVIELTAREGMTVAAGAPLFRIASLDRVWVNAELPEQAMAALTPGAAVEVSVPALGAATFSGRVAALLPDIDAATRTRKARIELANPGRRLQPGMFANITLHEAGQERGLGVPSDAVIQTGARSLVYVAEAGGRYRPVEVRTGREAGGQTEVKEGLALGQKVVVGGQFLLDSEASLRGVAAEPLAIAPVRRAPAATTMSATSHAMPPTAAAPAPQYQATGRIEKVGAQSITLSHEPIPALSWPAMTMDFMLASPLPPGLQTGQMVDFSFSREGKRFRIESIQPARHHEGAKP